MAVTVVDWETVVVNQSGAVKSITTATAVLPMYINWAQRLAMSLKSDFICLQSKSYSHGGTEGESRATGAAEYSLYCFVLKLTQLLWHPPLYND